jgi:hypothetical protein
MEDYIVAKMATKTDGKMFVTRGGHLSTEYPDAQIFTSMRKANAAAKSASEKHNGFFEVWLNYGYADETLVSTALEGRYLTHAK